MVAVIRENGTFGTGVDLNPHVTFFLPGGAVILALDLPALLRGEGRAGAVTMPGIGSVDYQVTIGPPTNVPAADLLTSRASGLGLVLAVAVGAFLLAKLAS